MEMMQESESLFFLPIPKIGRKVGEVSESLLPQGFPLANLLADL